MSSVHRFHGPPDDIRYSCLSPGLIQSSSRDALSGLSAWVEVGRIASSLCPKELSAAAGLVTGSSQPEGYSQA
jgi:hypothetical protein